MAANTSNSKQGTPEERLTLKTGSCSVLGIFRVFGDLAALEGFHLANLTRSSDSPVDECISSRASVLVRLRCGQRRKSCVVDAPLGIKFDPSRVVEMCMSQRVGFKCHISSDDKKNGEQRLQPYPLNSSYPSDEG